MLQKEGFNQIKYQNEYNKNKYDRLTITVMKGEKSKIEEYADKQGYHSPSEYIRKLIYDDMLSGGGQN